jgi:hypothetical protein
MSLEKINHMASEEILNWLAAYERTDECPLDEDGTQLIAGMEAFLAQQTAPQPEPEQTQTSRPLVEAAPISPTDMVFAGVLAGCVCVIFDSWFQNRQNKNSQ